MAGKTVIYVNGEKREVTGKVLMTEIKTEQRVIWPADIVEAQSMSLAAESLARKGLSPPPGQGSNYIAEEMDWLNKT